MLNQKRVVNLVDKALYIDRVWEILSLSYRDVPGGLLFSDKIDLIVSTALWKVVLKKGRVIAVTVFKAKRGMKLVAMGADVLGYGKQAIIALSKSIREDMGRVWMEVSGSAEDFLMKHCGAYRYVIHNSYASSLLHKSVITQSDGYHYVRDISHIKKSKIIVGTPYMSDLYDNL